MAPPETFAAYRATRAEDANTGVLCHAPFVSLNFARNGTVTSCCYNRSAVLGSYPADDLDAIWNGERARALRDAFLRDETAYGCDLCFSQLRSGNFGGVLMRNFDRFSTDASYAPRRDVEAPRVLEFEISNACNLECVMCHGEWSSSIRAHREHLPPLHSPYDRAFVTQIARFLPSIRAAKFLGGEPFMVSLYYDIWEQLCQVNPNAELTITTNGTRYPPAARALVEGLRVNFVVSLDSLDAATFERIRPGARFDEVMANIETFAEYAARKKTDLAISICPMQSNWRGLADLARFCADRRLWLHFNTVTRPREQSLAALPVDELAHVIAELERDRPHDDGDWWTQYHLRAWDGMVSQLRTWHARKTEVVERSLRTERDVRDRMAEAGSPAVAAVEQQALSFAIRGLCAGRNLTALAGEPDELARLLIDDLGDAATAFGPMELLRALHSLHAVDGASDDAAPHDALDRCIETLSADTTRADALDRWLRARLQHGEWDATARWLRALLDVTDAPARWTTALDAGLNDLRERGLSDEECQTAGRYLANIVPFAPLSWDIERPIRGVADAVRPADEYDLPRLFDAMSLYSRGSRPAADHDAFRRRLDASLAMIRQSGLERAVALSLTKTDLLTTFDALANASDAELAAFVQQAHAVVVPA